MKTENPSMKKNPIKKAEKTNHENGKSNHKNIKSKLENENLIMKL